MAQISVNGITMISSETSPYAGNIASLTWNGKEFLKQGDTGFMTSIAPGDGDGHIGTQSYMGQFQSQYASGNYFENRIRMRYKDGSGLSNDYCTAKITIGWAPLGLDKVLVYDVTHEVGDDHSVAGGVFEELEAGMPPEFIYFYTMNPVTKAITQVNESGAGYRNPLIITTADKQHAIGFYSPDTYPEHDPSPFSYVCLDYTPNFVRFSPTLWRIEARGYQQPRVPIGTYTFHNLVPIGSYEDVTRNLREIIDYFNPAYDYQVIASLGNHSLSSDVPNLTQHNILTVNNVSHVLSSDTPNIPSNYACAINNAVHGLSSDVPVIEWSHFLVIDSNLSLMTSDVPALTQIHILKGASAFLADGLILADGSITAGSNFVAFHSLVSENAWNYILYGIYAFSADGQFLADGTITAGINLGASHGLVSDTPELNNVRCDADNAQHSLLTSLVGLTQIQTLVVNNSSHAMLSDGVVLNEDYYLVLENILHASVSETFNLVEGKTVSVNNILHTLVSSNPVLEFSQVLVMQDINHKTEGMSIGRFEWFGDWRDYKETGGPWMFNNQENKWGYLNNPRWSNRG